MKTILSIISILFIFDFHLQADRVQAAKTSVSSREDAFQWLDKYGYNPCSGSSVQCTSDLASLLKRYQRLFKLDATGKLDDATKKHMSRPRCGIQDKPDGPLALSAYKWKKSSLKYAILGYPKQISQSTTRTIIRDAFQAWTDHVPFDIQETCVDCQPDLVVNFASGSHDDGYPFDGASGTLAHAFYPEDGRIHFDKDEPWTERFDDAKINLYLVAVHEIGHALGLNHNYNEDSIMYPSYQLMPKNKILPQVDRVTIQRMYGGKQSEGYNTPAYTTKTTATTTTTTTRRPTIYTAYPRGNPNQNSNPRCRMFLDAAFKHPDGTLHTFVETIVRRYLPDEHQWEERSSSYREKYPGLPSTLGAAVYYPENKQALFFTPKYVHVYDIDHSNQAKIRYNAPLPKTYQKPILGALYYKNSLRVVSTNTIALFDLSRTRIKNELPINTEFPGFHGTLKTAFSYGHLHHFFNDEDLVFVWNELSNDWETFGRPMENSWFACSDNPSFLAEKGTTKLSVKHRHRVTISRHQHHHHPH